MTATSKAARLRNRMPAIDPDSITPPPPAIHVAPEPPQSAPEPAVALVEPPAVVDVPADREAAEKSQPKRAAAKPAAKPVGEWETALDDPSIAPGRSYYRSFYIEDTVFARFRAAIHWSSRREDSEGEVPENMSVAISEYMERTASELEKRFNGGKVFRPTPEQRKKRKTRVADKK